MLSEREFEVTRVLAGLIGHGSSKAKGEHMAMELSSQKSPFEPKRFSNSAYQDNGLHQERQKGKLSIQVNRPYVSEEFFTPKEAQSSDEEQRNSHRKRSGTILFRHESTSQGKLFLGGGMEQKITERPYQRQRRRCMASSPQNQRVKVRATFDQESGKATYWAQCTETCCRKWRRLPRMAAHESLHRNWTCPDLKDCTCSLAEEKPVGEKVLTKSGERQIYYISKQQFYAHVDKYYASIELRRRKGVMRTVIGYQPVDLYRLYREVIGLGGCDAVTARPGQWGEIFHRMTHFKVRDASHKLKLLYKQCLYLYEQYFYFGINYKNGVSDSSPYVRPRSLVARSKRLFPVCSTGVSASSGYSQTTSLKRLRFE
mmetsp:Transcript_7755/g.12654  ORF Transcript_7755/g.12654 Transcript_7755/m.12654 type:complete len:371 (+) Transcript_7755:48-1160(+)